MIAFEWDAGNLEHIAKHDVTQLEAEEVCLSDTLVLDQYDVDDEERMEELGETASGRILKVVTTERGGRLRVVTAYDAVQAEKKFYLRSKMAQ